VDRTGYPDMGYVAAKYKQIQGDGRHLDLGFGKTGDVGAMAG
jgi:hypothetical protein